MRWLIWILFCLAGTMLQVARAEPLSIYTMLTGRLQYYDEHQKLSGYAVEIVREIQHRIGDQTEIKVVPWARGYESALKLPNVMLFSTVRTQERDALFKWAGPLIKIQYVFYKRNGNPLKIESMDDARKVAHIGAIRQDIREQLLIRFGFGNFESVKDNVLNARMLMSERIDLLVESPIAIEALMKEAGYTRQDVVRTIPIADLSAWIAFSKETPDAVVSQWQQALDGMYRDGSVQRALQKWYPNEPSVLPTHS